MKVAKGYFSTFPHLMCKGLPAYEQITFIWLFHHANSEGICFPSINTLSEECGISRDSIKRSLKTLEDRGYIKKEIRKKDDGGNASNLYSVMLIDQANSTEGGANSTQPLEANSTEGGANTATNYNQLTKSNFELNNKNLMCDKPHEPLPKKEFNYSEEFENTWAYYPKRQGANSKVTAYKHWRTRIAEGVKNEDLLIATKNYQVLMSNCGSTGTAYVMQAQRFYGANKEYEQFINIKPEELIHAEHSRNNQTGSYKSDKQRREEVNESINRITADIDLSNAF
jgi:hypothetical protein